jgi:hypothetical protein
MFEFGKKKSHLFTKADSAPQGWNSRKGKGKDVQSENVFGVKKSRIF